MAKPYIAAFKAGASSVTNYITTDQLIYWYRPQPKTTNCDATDTCMQPVNNPNYYIGRPNGWETVADNVFVVALLQAPGVLQVTSGGKTSAFNAPAGASSFAVPMGIGKQMFSLTRDSKTVLSATSLKDIIDGCVCGLYNFNAYGTQLTNGEMHFH
jgi:Glycosyl hydrolase family 71